MPASAVEIEHMQMDVESDDTVAGVLVFGGYLALLTALGFEHTQAFTALDHPGFKHFVRLRVRRDGSGIDGFCVGLADPLGKSSEPVHVGTFRWRPKSAAPH